jgi:uncharacterized protein YbjQ (UPF0145 family)
MCPGLISPEHISICEVIILDEEITRISLVIEVRSQMAKDTSMQEMMQCAEAMGANAIVGIDIDYETIGETNSMLMVATSGTAVVI